MVRNKIRHPIKRHGTYPDQKPIHPKDISFVEKVLAPNQIYSFQVSGRTLLYPVLKKINHLERGIVWTDAIGDLEILYDADLEYVFIKNMNRSCGPLTIRFKIV